MKHGNEHFNPNGITNSNNEGAIILEVDVRKYYHSTELPNLF